MKFSKSLIVVCIENLREEVEKVGIKKKSIFSILLLTDKTKQDLAVHKEQKQKYG